MPKDIDIIIAAAEDFTKSLRSTVNGSSSSMEASQKLSRAEFVEAAIKRLKTDTEVI